MRLVCMLCVAIFATCFQMNAQDTNTRNALINYSFNINDALIKGLDDYEPITEREKKMIRDVADERRKQFMDIAFGSVTSNLEKKKSIELLPVSSMEGTVSYHQGYPFPLMTLLHGSW